jgi:hypothetical protein
VTHPVGLFVGEGSPIPVAQGATGSSTVGPVRKLSFICVVSAELEEQTPENASILIGRMMGESAGRSLDAAVFDSNPSDATRPAGLLHGVAAIAATTSAATIGDSISSDIGKLAQAFADAFIDFQDMILITNTSSYLQYQTTRGFAELPVPCLPSMTVPSGTVIGIAPQGIGTGFSGSPEIEISKYGVAHFESAAPLPIGSPGSPPTVAAPARELAQANLLGIKLRLKCAWAVLQPGAVQQITGATW